MSSSSQSFHVHPLTGEPGRCRAEQGNCPFGNSDHHFESREAARAFYENFADRMTDPGRSVEFHFVTWDEKIDLTQGDCDTLARRIRQSTGWPLVLMSTEPAESPEKVDWDHMAVRAPDGRIVDALGIWTEADFSKNWAQSPVVTDVGTSQWDNDGEWDTRWDSDPVSVAERIIGSMRNLGLYDSASSEAS